MSKIVDLIKRLGSSVIIFSAGIQDNPLSNLVYEVNNNKLKVTAVNLPFVNNQLHDTLEDIAIITDAVIVPKKMPQMLNPKAFGKCKKCAITSVSTSIHGASKNYALLQKRINQLKELITTEESDIGRVQLSNRLSSLLQKIGYIYVGGSTEVEKFEIRDKITDSLNAGKLAMQHGVVAGGGCTFIHAAKSLQSIKLEEEEQQYGVDILKRALMSPTIEIINNSGKTGKYYAELISQLEYPLGYDLKSNNICNMVSQGIIDPCKVLTTCIEDSISMAALVLSTECILVKEKNFPLNKELGNNFREI